MNKKKLFIAFSVSVAIVILLGFVSAQTNFALECYVIKVVDSEKPPVSIEPPGLMLKKGDCVVWFNASSDMIKVRFLDNKGCEHPIGFNKEDTCFVTNWTARGETMSLVLNEPGSYDFEISTKTKSHEKILGRISVAHY